VLGELNAWRQVVHPSWAGDATLVRRVACNSKLLAVRVMVVFPLLSSHSQLLSSCRSTTCQTAGDAELRGPGSPQRLTRNILRQPPAWHTERLGQDIEFDVQLPGSRNVRKLVHLRCLRLLYDDPRKTDIASAELARSMRQA